MLEEHTDFKIRIKFLLFLATSSAWAREDLSPIKHIESAISRNGGSYSLSLHENVNKPINKRCTDMAVTKLASSQNQNQIPLICCFQPECHNSMVPNILYPFSRHQ